VIWHRTRTFVLILGVRHKFTTVGIIAVVEIDAAETIDAFLGRIERLRSAATSVIAPSHRAGLGQFFTPLPVARHMASLFETPGRQIRLLDAGAGVGVLSGTFVAELCSRASRPDAITVCAYEVDRGLEEYLEATAQECRALCEQFGVSLQFELRFGDFVRETSANLRSPMLATREHFDCAIINPPYQKINSNSAARRALSAIGIETSNLYTGFLALAVRLLANGGQLVAITPRSFTNGPYFKRFRKEFLSDMSFRDLHIYESRKLAFRENDVLQENIIFRAVKAAPGNIPVTISTSSGPNDQRHTYRQVTHAQLVDPNDPQAFVHIVPDDQGQAVARRMRSLPATLDDLGITVSTGRVVDFRAEAYLRGQPGMGTAPLIYPGHLSGGLVVWPRRPFRKPNALAIDPATEDLFVPVDFYVLVKRFSAKEERRRVTAALFEPARVTSDRVAFENHLNYFHHNGRGLPRDVAAGLMLFLNSSMVDDYFRQFNGHTQVNATDLRTLRYPSLKQLRTLGARLPATVPGQQDIDSLVAEEVLGDAEGQPADARAQADR
jgi:adenine-specific DNA-methyltransferase